MNDEATPREVGSTEGLGPLPDPAGFTAGDHDGALFTPSRRTAMNYALGARLPLREWYSADQMRVERERCYALGVAAERNRCRYPQCVANEDERCPRWLTGECEGPNVGAKRGGTVLRDDSA